MIIWSTMAAAQMVMCTTEGLGSTGCLHGSLAGINIVLTDPGFNQGDAAFDSYISIEFFEGSHHADYLEGDANDNTFLASSGADIVKGGGGSDTLMGNSENDTSVAAPAMIFFLPMWASTLWTAVTVATHGVSQGNGGRLAVRSAGRRRSSDTWTNWEDIQGSNGSDRIRTNSWGFQVELRGGGGNDVLATGVSGIVDDILRGEGGQDDLNGGAGNDFLDGGADADTMTGATGNDSYFVGSGGDRIFEALGNGTDSVSCSVSYALAAGVSVETIQTLGVATTTSINLTGNELVQTLHGERRR